MSISVRELLATQVDHAGDPELDLARLMTAGERRIRHRRVATVVVSILTVVTLAVGPYLLLRGGNPPPARQPRLEDPPSVTDVPTPDAGRRLTFAEPDGTSIHIGEQRVSVTGRLTALDASDGGVVFATDNLRLWFTDGDQPRPIGRVGGGTDPMGAVVTGDTGSLAAWIEPTGSTSSDFVVYDTSSRQAIVRRHLSVPSDSASVFEVVGDHVYWLLSGSGGDRVMRYDAVSGAHERVDEEDFMNDSSARRILILGDVGGSERVVDGLALNFVVAGNRLLPRNSDGVATESLHTSDEQLVALRPPRGFTGSASLFQWLSDDVIALVGEQGGEHPFLVCQLPRSTCGVADHPDEAGWPIVPDVPLPPLP